MIEPMIAEWMKTSRDAPKSSTLHQSQPPRPAMKVAAVTMTTLGMVAVGMLRTSSKTVVSR